MLGPEDPQPLLKLLEDMPLPQGTLTFLFTDIEGSSHLWESDPQAMKPSLALHDAILIQEIKANQGTTFKRIGDAFCAVFPTADLALRAAIGIQTRMNEPVLEGMIDLNVRVALHSGTAEVRENDYYGPTVNRVARILSLTYGGQILVSQVTEGLCTDQLPTDAELISQGEVILRQMTRPERLYQVMSPNFPCVFPPIKDAVPSATGNLTSFDDMSDEAEATKAILIKAQQKSGSTVNRESLLRAAAEMGISASAVAKAEAEYRIQQQDREIRAQYLQLRRASAYNVMWSWGGTFAFFTVIYLLTGPGQLFWPAFPIIGWGIWALPFIISHLKDSPQVDAQFENWKIKQNLLSKGQAPPTDLDDGLDEWHDRKRRKRHRKW